MLMVARYFESNQEMRLQNYDCKNYLKNTQFKMYNDANPKPRSSNTVDPYRTAHYEVSSLDQ